MAESIDELKIEIEAEAGNASGTIDELSDELKNLQRSIGNLDVSKLNELRTSLQSLGNIKFGTSQKEIQKLDDAIGKVTSDISKELTSDLINSFNISDKKIQSSVSRISNEFAKLNQKNIFEDSDESIIALSKSMQQLEDSVSKGARGSVDDAYKDFYEYWRNLDPIYISDKVINDINRDNWNDLIRGTSDAGNTIGKFTNDVSKMQNSVDSLYREMQEKYPSIFPQSDSYSTEQEEVENIVAALKEYRRQLNDTGDVAQRVREILNQTNEAMQEGYASVLGTESSSMSSLQSAYSERVNATGSEQFSDQIQVITELVNALRNIPKEDKISGLIDQLENLGEVVSRLNNISDVADGINKLVEATANFPQKDAFKNFTSSLKLLNDSGDYKNLENIANYIDRLSESMAAFSSSRVYNVNINAEPQNAPTESDVTNAENYVEVTEEVAEAQEEAAEASHVMSESMQEASSSTIHLRSSVKETAQESSKLDSAFAVAENGTKRLMSAIKQLMASFAKQTLNNAASSLRRIGSSALSAGRNVTTLAKGFSDIALQHASIAKIPETFRSISNVTDTLNKKMSRLVSMFTRMAIRRAYSEVFKQLGDAFEHLSNESESVNSHMESLSSALSQLAHNITAAAEPLLNIFGPAIEYVIGVLDTAITYVNQFLAALSGKRYVSAATSGISTYSDGLETLASDADEAADANARLNKQLQGFNELNNLTTSETNTGSSGSGSSGEGYEGGYYEDIDISQDILDFVEKLKQAWEDADFTEIGDILGRKLMEGLEAIPWDEIQGMAEKIAHSLATFINGFIEVEDLGTTIGNTIGEAFNTALIFADEFITTLHWDSLGTFVADTLNGAVESVDWELLGKTLGDSIAAWLEYGFNFVTTFDWSALGDSLAKSVNALLDVANTALTSYDWTAIGSSFTKGLNSAISGMDWNSLGTLLGNWINTLLGNISGAVNSFDFSGFGTSIANALNSAISTANWSGIGTTIKNALNGVFSSAGSWASTFDFSELGSSIASAINSALNDINWGSAISSVSKIASGIASGLNSAITTSTFSSLGSTLGSVINSVVSGAYSFVGTVDWSGWGKAIGNGISSFFANVSWSSLGVTISDIGVGLMNLLSESIESIEWDQIGADIADMIRNINWLEALSGIADIIIDALLAGLEFTGSFVGGLLFGTDEEGNVLNPFEDILDSMSAAWDDFVDSHPALAAFLTGGEEEVEASVSLEFHVSDDSLVGCYDLIEQWFEDYPLSLEAIIDRMFVDIDDKDRVMECVAEIIELITGKEASNYQIEGVTAIIETLKAKNGKLEVEDVEVALQAYALITELQYNLDDEERTIEIIGLLYKLLVGRDASDITIEGLTGVIEYLETKGQFTIENVTAAVIAYGYLEELYDNLNDNDKRVEIIGKIIELFVGSNADGTVVDDLTGIIDDLINNDASPLGVIAAIYDYMIENGLVPEIDGEVNVTDADVKEGTKLEVPGSMWVAGLSYDEELGPLTVDGDLTVNNVHVPDGLTIDGVIAYVQEAMSNGSLSLSGLIGYITQALATGQLSISDVNALISSLVANGTLSLSDVKAIASALEAQSGVSLKSPVYATSLDANGNNVSAPFSITKYSDTPTPSGAFKIGSYSNTPVPSGKFSIGSYSNTPVPSAKFNISSYSSTPVPSAKFKISSYSSTPVPSAKFKISSYSSTPVPSAKFKISSYSSTPTPSAKFKISSYSSTPVPSGKFKIKSYSSTPTISSPAKVTKITKASNVSLTLSGTVSSSGSKTSIKFVRTGGILHNGVWSDIPQYADGTTNAGSLFIAGEDGPELVGHIRNQTEVLNQSQLASVMKNAVMDGIANLASYLNGISSFMSTCANRIIGAIAVNYNVPDVVPNIDSCSNFNMRFGEMSTDMNEIIGLLSEIASNTDAPVEEEVYADADNMFKVLRRKNTEYRNATGRSAFA